MKKNILVSIILFLSFFCFVKISQTATINATSCLQPEVQAAIGTASDGDTVAVHAGTCTWGAGGVGLSINKQIILQGAGIDVTTIRLASDCPMWIAGGIQIVAPNVTIKGFSFDRSTMGNAGTVIGINGAEYSNFRVTGNLFFGLYGDCNTTSAGYVLGVQ
jgi:hypothetical protein